MTVDDGHDASNRTDGRPLAAVLLAVLLLASAPLAMTPVGAAQPAPELPAEPAFVIALEPDGSARTTVTVVFDLTTTSERDAFEALRANTTAREQRVKQFATHMQAVADRAEAKTGREMRISDPSIQFVERGDTGIVALSVTWEGLAAQSGDGLMLREPFASEFIPDRAFYVVAPDGYKLAMVNPAPAERNESLATWTAGNSLDGFEVTIIPATEGTTTTSDAPGFGFGIAVLALLLAIGLLLRRTHNQPDTVEE